MILSFIVAVPSFIIALDFMSALLDMNVLLCIVAFALLFIADALIAVLLMNTVLITFIVPFSLYIAPPSPAVFCVKLEPVILALDW